MGNICSDKTWYTRPELYPVNVNGKESNIVCLFDIINFCSETYENPVVEPIRQKFIKEYPVALNFIMRSHCFEDLYGSNTWRKIIELSSFHKHRGVQIEDYFRLTNEFNIDEQKIKCLLTDDQLKLFNFIKDHSHLI